VLDQVLELATHLQLDLGLHPGKVWASHGARNPCGGGGPGSGSASGGPGGAVEGARPGRGAAAGPAGGEGGRSLVTLVALRRDPGTLGLGRRSKGEARGRAGPRSQMGEA
jgi:hypothetical protein